MRSALTRGSRPVAIAATMGVLAGVLALAGCDNTPPPAPQNFAPLHYDYLTPIRLNVADIEVADQSTPPDGDLSGQSPVRPVAAMEQMAHDRLLAAGGAGTATFTVTEASITRTDDGVTERLAARVEISNGSGGHAGFAEAHVTRTETPGDGRPAGPAALYELTRQAMADMNVEFEYQVRHTLNDWVVAGGAAVEAPVEQAPLSPGAPSGPTPLSPVPFSPPPSTSPEGAPLPLSPSTGDVGYPPPPPGPDTGAPTSLVPPPAPGTGGVPPSMSPPPGYLALPPGASPTGGLSPSDGNVPPSSQAYPSTAAPGY